MEELNLALPRPQTREEPILKSEETQDYSPLKAYMIKRGAFPGSSHIVQGENPELLMSNFY
jgi:hypothetical protein